jgi:tyrosinase
MPEKRPQGPPPEMVAASEEAVVLTGEPVAVALPVPERIHATMLDSLDEGRDSRAYLSVDDLRAEHNPGVVYGVYLNMPDEAGADRHTYHVGNIAPFGIEHLSDRDGTHEGAPGLRHVFDITARVVALREARLWDPAALTVTFEIIPPLPPPGQEAMADTILEEQMGFAKSEPLHIGRVSLFVG